MGNDGSTAMESKLFILEIRNFIEKFEILFVWKIGNLFNLKFAAKELERSAKKCEKDSVNEKLKLKRVKIHF